MTGSQIGGNFGSVQIGTSSGWKVLIKVLISGSDVDVVRLIQRVLAITDMLVAFLDRECLLLVKYSSITDLVD